MAEVWLKRCCGKSLNVVVEGGNLWLRCPVCGRKSLAAAIVGRRPRTYILDPAMAEAMCAAWNLEVEEDERRKAAHGGESGQWGKTLDESGDRGTAGGGGSG